MTRYYGKVRVATDQSLHRRVVASLGRLVFGVLLPLINFRGAVSIGSCPGVRRLRVWVEEGAARFQMPPFDFYWGRYLYSGRPYEPEVASALRLATSTGAALFIDAGANYGYWAARVAAGEFGEHDVVAIEASAPTLELLEANLRGTRARVVAAAVSAEPGYVTFDDGALHVARGITNSGAGTRVRAITLDEVAESAPRVIVKLDVEGAEVAALAGAPELLRRDVCLIFECHGSDRECRATKAALGAGLKVFSLNDMGAVTTITSAHEVRALKTDNLKGYNFVAASEGVYSSCFADVADK